MVPATEVVAQEKPLRTQNTWFKNDAIIEVSDLKARRLVKLMN
jgi:hypothetical protein